LQFGLFAKVRGRGAITILDGMGSKELLNAEEIEQGGHDGDQ